MAKTKTTHRKNNTTTKSTDHQNPQDASEKLTILKSLNTMLLKEIVERRQEVKCLLESKKAMEIDIARISSDVEGVKSQFTRFVDENIIAYLEKDLLSAFMESQVQGIADELEGEIKKEKEMVDRLTRERNGFRRDLNALMEETESLNHKLTEIKNREMKREGEIKEANGVIELLKKQIEEREREKALLNKEKYQQLTKISELEKEIGAVKAAGTTTKKNFWALAVSSATTIVAVAIASFACVNNSRKGR